MKGWLLPLAAALLLGALLFPRPYDGREVPPGELPPLVTTPAQIQALPADRLDLNTATLEQLQALPGIGPIRAQSILDYRSQNGPFQSVEELAAVEGIGAGIMNQVGKYLCITP